MLPRDDAKHEAPPPAQSASQLQSSTSRPPLRSLLRTLPSQPRRSLLSRPPRPSPRYPRVLSSHAIRVHAPSRSSHQGTHRTTPQGSVHSLPIRRSPCGRSLELETRPEDPQLPKRAPMTQFCARHATRTASPSQARSSVRPPSAEISSTARPGRLTSSSSLLAWLEGPQRPIRAIFSLRV